MIVSHRNRGFKELSDEKLIARYLSEKDLEILGALFQRYIHLVYGVCLKYFRNREESKDSVMQIFEKLITEIEKHEVTSFRGWLYVLTKHYCLRRLQTGASERKKIQQFSAEQFMESEPVLSPFDETPEKDMNEALNRCIEKLRIEQRQCIQLFYFEEKCYQEISDTLQIALTKVKSYIQNGKRNLKICLEKENGQTKQT